MDKKRQAVKEVLGSLRLDGFYVREELIKKFLNDYNVEQEKSDEKTNNDTILLRRKEDNNGKKCS